MALEQVGQVGGPAALAEGLGRERSVERAWEGARRLPVVPLAVLALFVAMALVGPWMAPRDPDETDLLARLSPPAWVAGGTADHLLGTDRLGRDVWSRIIVGARPSFVVALVTIIVGGALGTFIGLVAGYFSGRVDAVVMRFADSAISFPLILLALLLAAVIGPGIVTVVVAISLLLWARLARLIRGEVLSLKERDFVALARVAGVPWWRILLVHILPNVLNTVVVLLTLDLGLVIGVEATLSFLGAGIPPPTPTWGQMVADGRAYVATAWWLSLFPGLAIGLVILSFNLVGDWLRDYLDPRLREAR
jgi:peptide/nickel transport system permease protein